MTFATKCWNCGSSNFVETVSLEECRSCGISCHYHGGGGANDEYLAAMDRKHYLEKEEQERLFAEQFEHDWGVPYR